MKKLAFAFIMSFTLTTTAQDLKNWQVGFNINPFIFDRINPEKFFIKSKQDFPNGFGWINARKELECPLGYQNRYRI
jgi:hypothetical protein